MRRAWNILLLLGLLSLGACFGGQGLKVGDLAPQLEQEREQETPTLKGPAVLVFLRGFG